MSEFTFVCPECGQKILGDTAYSNTQIICLGCQKSITVPSVSDAPPPAGAIPPTSSRSAPPPSPMAAAPKREPDRFSALAIASLICSVFVPLGSVPGIICGHMAKARMRRNIFLVGEKLANAGLLISYCVLTATIVMTGIFFLARWHFSPVKVLRDSPAAIAAMEPRIVDQIVIGENEDDHDVDGIMQYVRTSKGKSSRSTGRGGSFSYTMKVLPHEPMTLNCRYWGSEKKGHLFDIAVDDQIIATQDLTLIAPGHYVDVEYKIPTSLTRGKTDVTVEFQAHERMAAGPLYGCEMLKR